MKKKFSLVVFFCLFFLGSYAQSLISNGQINASIKLISSTESSTVINFIPGQVSLHAVQTQNGRQFSVSLESATPILNAGAPDLPKLAASIVIPDLSAMEAYITDSAFTDYNNISIAPSKGTISRVIDPSTIPFTYSDVYTNNQFYPLQLVTLRDPYILRDVRAQTVIVNPVQYNPVTKVLRVYSKITVTVTTASGKATVINPFYRNNIAPNPSPEFEKIYSTHFLNYNKSAAINVGARFTPVDDGNRMLIIAYQPFKSIMQPFIKWKEQEGIAVDMIDVDSLQNNADTIKAYAANYYNQHGLTYLLLVGDAPEVPSDTEFIANLNIIAYTDNKYSYIVGKDHYPDIFVGRFSGETNEDIKTQVDRTIAYEKNPMGGNWFKRGVCVADDVPTLGNDSLYDWQQERLIRAELLGFTYSDVAELYDGSQGGADAPGDPMSSDLTSVLDSGVSVMNYTGHGDYNVLVTTGFDNYNAEVLNNAGMLPFIWIVGCNTGQFVGLTCFGEVLMRSEDSNNQPIGSVANFSSTIQQYWDQPMEAQLGFNAILTGNEHDSTIVPTHTFGGISFNGCMEMNDKYGQTGYDMTDTWECFGDPTLMVRTDVPPQITATHAPGVWLGINSFQVFCNTEGAKVCLWANGQILGTAIVSSSSATINFASPLNITADTMWVTITYFNKIPYQQPVLILDNIATTSPGINFDAFFNIYPNPSDGNATISYAVASTDNVSIRIINTVGQVIKVLADNESQAGGTHQYALQGSNLTAGIYIVELDAGDKKYFRKLVVQ